MNFIYLGLACLSVSLCAAVICIRRRTLAHLKTTPLTKDSNFQSYARDGISSRLVEIKQTINNLRVDCAAMKIELASLKAKTQTPDDT